jgi:hypothetical protein
MNKLHKFLVVVVAALTMTSCEKFLDVNENPNNATTATPELILRQAVVSTASSVVNYNSYGGRLVGYYANAGGVSGWGDIVSYNYSTGTFASLFESVYKINNDLRLVVEYSRNDDQHNQFIAAAKTLQAYNFQNLVDVYNDVPYFSAMKGAEVLQPTYDKAEDIYKDLAVQLDSAIAFFNAEPKGSTRFGNSDPLFGGDVDRWIRFANTIKLRLVIRGGSKVAFENTTFDAKGFLTEDALVNPGYVRQDGKQNPFWNAYAYNAAGTAVTTQVVPTPYLLSFYNGGKINDPDRVNIVFKSGLATPTNQLGYQEDDAKKSLSPSGWFIGTSATNYDKIGLLKGPDAPMPLMLASESYFLQAQANLRNIAGVPGTAESNYKAGILASFKYLNKDNTGSVPSTRDFATQFNNYYTANAGNRLVDFSAAATDEQKLEAIVTQQYIAYNMIFGHQAWFEFLRTGYPAISGPNSVANKSNTFVSIVSEATGPNKLPARILYPASEFKYNSGNIPSVDKYTSKLFYAK